MEIRLIEKMFKDGEYSLRYGNRRATFTIIDETFAGNNRLGRVNRVNCAIRQYDEYGKETGAALGMPVVGLGNTLVGVRGDDRSLNGEVLSRDNMDRCVVILHEEV
jgi:hypothetical protein